MLTITACGNKGNIENTTPETEAITETETETEDVTPLTNVDRGDSNGNVVNNEHPETSSTQQNQQTSSNSESTTNNTGLYIYIDDDGILRCAKSLKATLEQALKDNGLSVSENMSLLINKYYQATLNEDNTKIHHDIADSCAKDLAEELTDRGQDSGNSNSGTTTDNQSGNNSNNSGNIGNSGSTSNNSNTGSGSSSNIPEAPADDDPWTGDGTFSGFDDLGDGGELIGDTVLNP